jgi:hypothetical protein
VHTLRPVVLLILALEIPGAESLVRAQTTTQSAGGVVVQAQPVYTWLQAVQEGDADQLQGAFSARMRKVFEAEGWKSVLTRYRNAFEQAFGDYRLEEFTFTFAGGEQDGKVVIVHKGRALPGVMVVREPGGWKVNER